MVKNFYLHIINVKAKQYQQENIHINCQILEKFLIKYFILRNISQKTKDKKKELLNESQIICQLNEKYKTTHTYLYNEQNNAIQKNITRLYFKISNVKQKYRKPYYVKHIIMPQTGFIFKLALEKS